MTEPSSEQLLLLLVEDEPLMRIANEDTLTEQGFHVIASADGHQGMRELEHDASRFSVVVTDVRLGSGPSGWDIGHRARALLPAMPIVYTTAESAAEWAANGVPGSILIEKPFVPAQLVTAIATLLNQSNSFNPHELGPTDS
ncbi:response regulator [Rhizobium sp. RCC_161_2]|uniref:response regulator n=1 Tax=Rhizobium sp. RCC_161_2 TaxID=3239219 RepID=UPI003525EC96